MSEWYSLQEIQSLTPEQIMWVLENAELLHEGVWPVEPIVSGYTDMPTIKKSGKKNARFTKPVEVIAEVDRRLKHLGLDGLMVYLYYAEDKDEYELGKWYKLSVDEVKFRIGAVLWHISGFNFYARPYKRWHCYRNYENWKGQRKEIEVP